VTQQLPYEMERQKSPCGCGASITYCDFWASAMQDIPLERGKETIGYFRESIGRRKTFRVRESVSLLTGIMSAGQARDARSYGSLTDT